MAKRIENDKEKEKIKSIKLTTIKQKRLQWQDYLKVVVNTIHTIQCEEKLSRSDKYDVLEIFYFFLYDGWLRTMSTFFYKSSNVRKIGEN